VKRRALLALIAASALLAQNKQPIQLHVDLTVEPAREKELWKNFATVFRPAIMKQPGFVDVKLMKFREVKAGMAPQGMNYRLLISFRTEEDRMNWVKSADHDKAWPTIEGTLKVKTMNVLLFDLQ
jgi:heme-degrading monooxygenase HmoA